MKSQKPRLSRILSFCMCGIYDLPLPQLVNYQLSFCPNQTAHVCDYLWKTRNAVDIIQNRKTSQIIEYIKIAKQELDHIRMGYITTSNTNNATLENLLQILFIYIILRIYLPVLIHLQYIPFAIEPFGDTHLFTMYPKSCVVRVNVNRNRT